MMLDRDMDVNIVVKSLEEKAKQYLKQFGLTTQRLEVLDISGFAIYNVLTQRRTIVCYFDP